MSQCQRYKDKTIAIEDLVMADLPLDQDIGSSNQLMTAMVDILERQT